MHAVQLEFGVAYGLYSEEVPAIELRHVEYFVKDDGNLYNLEGALAREIRHPTAVHVLRTAPEGR